jgi:hypothetical protein
MPADHPLRPLREMVNAALARVSFEPLEDLRFATAHHRNVFLDELVRSSELRIRTQLDVDRPSGAAPLDPFLDPLSVRVELGTRRDAQLSHRSVRDLGQGAPHGLDIDVQGPGDLSTGQPAGSPVSDGLEDSHGNHPLPPEPLTHDGSGGLLSAEGWGQFLYRSPGAFTLPLAHIVEIGRVRGVMRWRTSTAELGAQRWMAI